MITNLETGESSDYSRTAAVDSNFIFFDHLSVDSFLMRSWSPGVEEDTWAGRPVKIAWESDFFNANTEYMIIQRNFEADMGFIRRKDMQQSRADVTLHPRPNIEWIRRLTFGAHLTYITNQEGDLETRTQEFNFGTEWESGDRSMLVFARTLETITEPFLLRGELLVLPGTYSHSRAEIRYRTFPGRRFSTFQRFLWEGFWGGDHFSIRFNPNLVLTDQLTLGAQYTFDDISLPQGQLTSHVLNSVLRYNLNNSWLTSTTLQYDSTEDLFNLNLRLNYIYRPGDDVFLVFNRTSEPETVDWSVALKVTHSFDF